MRTIKNGNWFDPATWDTGKVPTETDEVTVTHAVTASKNIVIKGKLIGRPGAFIQFTGINESAFVGSGMDVLATDVGLWVMEGGTLDLQGSAKKGWTTAATDLKAGISAIRVNDCTGWKVGDEIVIAPTEKPDVNGNYLKGEERTITGIIETTITLNAPLSKDHLSVSFNGQTRYAEVMNLTRDVRVEGTPGGNSHIFIHAAARQVISYVQMRYMGPRKDIGGGTEKEFVPGRYGLHFHHAGEGSRGTVIQSCVVRDTGSHGIVPHGSNGITVRDCITFKTKEAAYWVDEGHPTHSITYDSCIAGDIGFVPRAITFEDPTSPTFGTHGFLLGVGDDCRCTGCVVWGQTGSEDDFGSYAWQANNEGVWFFEDNLAHNAMQATWEWQNTTKNHLVNRFTAYNCGHGILHGAYANSYTFKECNFYGCDVRFQANSADAGLHLINSYIDVAGLHDYAIDSRFGRVGSSYPIQVIGCTLKGYRAAPLRDTNGADENGWIKKMYDLINCTFVGLPQVPAGESGEIVRVQNQNGDGKAYQITPGNVYKAIAPFAPAKYGTGTGLKGEYFNDATFQTKVFERIDAPLAFQEWSNKPDEKPDYHWIDYRITGNAHSMRWTGQIEPQYSETYTIILDHAGSAKMWLNGVLTNTISAVAGQRFDIKIEYSNTDDSSGVNLSWKSAHQVQMYIPGSQMYPTTGGIVIPPATITLTATPNPTTTGWKIKAVSSVGGVINLTLLNSLGTIVAQADVTSGQVITYGSTLKKGTYILKATQGSTVKVITIIKQ